MAEQKDLLARLERMESTDEIRQLVGKYALALDMRDLNALAGLFPEDIRVSRDQTGRKALRKWFDEMLRERFTGTAHVTGNHIIEFDDPDHARGIVYSRNEHEMDGEWVMMTMIYVDHYDRIAGRWYFRRRLPLYWYATDLNKPPIGEKKMRWPDQDPYDGGYHLYWPSWDRFWDDPMDQDSDVPEPAPIDEFLKRIRGSDESISIRVK